MKIALPNVLLILGCLGASHAATGDTPTSIVRAQRAEYNAAIAAHDAVRLRTFFVDDYHLILGRRVMSTAAQMPQLAVTPTRNSRTRHSLPTDVPQRPLSLRHPGSGLRRQGALRASGESLME